MSTRWFMLLCLFNYTNYSLGIAKPMINSTIHRKIEIGKIYQHYSGKTYKVIAIAHDSESPNLFRVVYEGLYDCPSFGPNPVWDRPYEMFAEEVEINGIRQYRFTEIVS